MNCSTFFLHPLNILSNFVKGKDIYLFSFIYWIARALNNVQIYKKDMRFLFCRYQSKCCSESESERTHNKGQRRTVFQESILHIEQIEARKKHGNNRYHGKREERFRLFRRLFSCLQTYLLCCRLQPRPTCFTHCFDVSPCYCRWTACSLQFCHRA